MRWWILRSPCWLLVFEVSEAFCSLLNVRVGSMLYRGETRPLAAGLRQPGVIVLATQGRAGEPSKR